MRTLPFGSSEVDITNDHPVHAPAASGGSTQNLLVRSRGVDEIFGTADDGGAVTISTARAYRPNNNAFAHFGRGFAMDERVVAWADASTVTVGSVLPVVHSTGPDGVFGNGDDCEVEVNATPRPN